MASNDPTDTGGLFVGRRPGTRPLQYRRAPARAGEGRRRFDGVLAAVILILETIVLMSLWGPQPLFWLWVGSQMDFVADSVEVGIAAAFVGMGTTLMLTLWVARILDNAWKLTRRAAGHDQKSGALERIFVVSVGLGVAAFCIYFFLIEGPGSSLYSPQAN
jgi:hypothetical protein